MLYTIYYLLHTILYIPHPVSYMLYAICYMLFTTYHTVYVSYCLLYIDIPGTIYCMDLRCSVAGAEGPSRQPVWLVLGEELVV